MNFLGRPHWRYGGFLALAGALWVRGAADWGWPGPGKWGYALALAGLGWIAVGCGRAARAAGVGERKDNE